MYIYGCTCWSVHLCNPLYRSVYRLCVMYCWRTTTQFLTGIIDRHAHTIVYTNTKVILFETVPGIGNRSTCALDCCIWCIATSCLIHMLRAVWYSPLRNGFSACYRCSLQTTGMWRTHTLFGISQYSAFLPWERRCELSFGGSQSSAWQLFDCSGLKGEHRAWRQRNNRMVWCRGTHYRNTVRLASRKYGTSYTLPLCALVAIRWRSWVFVAVSSAAKGSKTTIGNYKNKDEDLKRYTTIYQKQK